MNPALFGLLLFLPQSGPSTRPGLNGLESTALSDAWAALTSDLHSGIAWLKAVQRADSPTSPSYSTEVGQYLEFQGPYFRFEERRWRFILDSPMPTIVEYVCAVTPDGAFYLDMQKNAWVVITREQLRKGIRRAPCYGRSIEEPGVSIAEFLREGNYEVTLSSSHPYEYTVSGVRQGRIAQPDIVLTIDMRMGYCWTSMKRAFFGGLVRDWRILAFDTTRFNVIVPTRISEITKSDTGDTTEQSDAVIEWEGVNELRMRTDALSLSRRLPEGWTPRWTLGTLEPIPIVRNARELFPVRIELGSNATWWVIGILCAGLAVIVWRMRRNALST